MGILKRKRYRKCEQNEDGTVDCVAYLPDKTGKKIPTATIKGQLTPQCQVITSSSDGDSGDIADLEGYLSERAKAVCKKAEL